ncbi:MAG: GLPGLI family protein [Allomuricauda sp.]
MKNIRYILSILSIVLFTHSGKAQDFKGKATYFSKTSVDLDLDGRQLSEEQKQRIRQRVKNSSERTYVLTFDKTSSLYQQEEKLDAPTSGGQGRGRGIRVAFGALGVGAKYYKNVQDQQYLSQTEMFGKQFLISDSLNQRQWELGPETKKIGNYTCYKATTIVEPDSLTFNRIRRMARRSQGTGRDSTRTNTILSRIEEPSERVVTVWYTPEIPISQGPGDYWGLPGLILEVNDGRTAILCTQIVLNAENVEEIKKPSKGKRVNQAEYDKILAEKMEEMSERFRNGNRRGGGNGIRIIRN